MFSLWIVHGLCGCHFVSVAPKTPECREERLLFSAQMTDISRSRTREDGFHNDGPNVAIIDIDNDGTAEILQCFPQESTYIYTLVGHTKIFGHCGFMLVEDLNQDGWYDLVVDAGEDFWGDHRIAILQNTQGDLEEVSSFSLGKDYARTIRAGDFNFDGLVDLFITKNGYFPEHSDRDVIAYRRGTWDFSIDEDALDLQKASRKAFDAIVLDINQDNRVDAYVANDRGNEFGGNAAWFSSSEGMVEDSACDCEPVQSSMGVDASDYNHDGFVDIITSDIQHIHLLEGQGDGSFVDMTEARGANNMEDWEMSWGIRFVDIDNDGQMEIFSAQGDHTYFGNIPEFVGAMGLSLQHMQEGRFVEVQEEYGFDMQGSFRSIVPFHWNGDGILDYWITQASQASVLMASNGCSQGNWLFVRGITGSAIRFRSYSDVFYGEVQGASSYAASIMPQIHFGLGDVSEIYDVEVRSPTGDWDVLYETLAVPNDIFIGAN